MSDKPQRLSKIAKEFNVGVDTILEFLNTQGVEGLNRNSKIAADVYEVLVGEYQPDKKVKAEAKQMKEARLAEEEAKKAEVEAETIRVEAPKLQGFKVVDKVNLSDKEEAVEATEEAVAEEVVEAPKEEVVEEIVAEEKPVEEPKEEPKEASKVEEPTQEEAIEEVAKEEKQEEAIVAEEKPAEEKVEEKVEKPTEEGESVIRAKAKKLDGPKIVAGQKIDLEQFKRKKKPVASSSDSDAKKKRKRINKKVDPKKGGGRKGKKEVKVELTPEQIQKQVRENLAKLQSGGKKKSAKLRREKRQARREQEEFDQLQQEEANKTIKVTEFVTTAELAQMMSVAPTQIISACFSLGMMVTQNQRLDAETLSVVAEEFGFTVEFVSAEVQDSIVEVEDSEDDLQSRAPIVTVMGHVDHGKTSLLDYVRKANVIAGEAGGITQHVGAYEVTLEDGKKITFLDTPGHEAFTAMRARGAQVTDVVIIVVAADDRVMPQTKEAISHAQAAGVPMVFALNKVDRDAANPDKIREQLANENILLEDWGGKFQSQEISAKTGQGIPELLEKVLLEAELLDLKANPEKNATGTVIEASLDKGKGYLTTILVEAGTLKVGDYVLAGCYSGKVKALLDERDGKMDDAGPSTPAVLLGLNGAAQAGDRFNVMDDEREAKNIAAKRMQLQREQGVRTQKHITLDEIGRRLALGDFQELNVIIKGDVDGSIEALSDSLQKLSTDQIAVNIIHKSVGQISESDVMLAAASDAIIIGFQVRPSVNARKLAETEQIDIRLYSVIYNAIEELEQAMEGMLSPDIEEKIVSNIEIRETFKISKVGTIAGCYVLDGKMTRNTRIRLIRDGIVIYTGELSSLKRFKDDVKEVSAGYECGLSVANYNDIKVGDIIEGFEEVEVKRTLS
jgi:translation initiation factor IF-2